MGLYGGRDNPEIGSMSLNSIGQTLSRVKFSRHTYLSLPTVLLYNNIISPAQFAIDSIFLTFITENILALILVYEDFFKI